jgi:hypothetical protein
MPTDEINCKVQLNDDDGSTNLFSTAQADYRLALVKRRQDFIDLIDGATHIDAVTYAETPSLMIDMLENHVETLDVLIGNAEDYQSNKVNSVDVARRLVELKQEERLTVRLINRKRVHAKMYRILMPDETVKLVHGSANMSENSWGNHANQIAVFETDSGSQIDEKFTAVLESFRDRYGHDELLADLVESVKNADNEDEKEKEIEYWVGGADVEQSDRQEIASKTVSKLNKVASENVTESADGTVSADGGTVERPSVNLAEETPDENMTLSTEQLDGTLDVEKSLRKRGATKQDGRVVTPLTSIANEMRDRAGMPLMSVSADDNVVNIYTDEKVMSTARAKPTPDALDRCLSVLEQFIETARFGNVPNEDTREAVKAQMYEAMIYGFWAPFASEYAGALARPSRTMTNILQHLYIHGASDAGKDKLIEYILRLISQGYVTSGEDADNVGVRDVRAVREYDSCFPYVLIDAEKETIKGWSVLRNYWEDYTLNTTDRPCLIFTTNDGLPSEEFRNRLKMLHMDITYPSSPRDENFDEAQEELSRVLELHNPIFDYVSYEMTRREPWNDDGPTRTVGDVRSILNEFYERANRTKPSYFPADKPAEETHSTGKRKWDRYIRYGQVDFELQQGALTADFDLEWFDVSNLEKMLPKRVRSSCGSTVVTISSEQEFADWIGYEISELIDGSVAESVETPGVDDNNDEGLLSKFF